MYKRIILMVLGSICIGSSVNAMRSGDLQIQSDYATTPTRSKQSIYAGWTFQGNKKVVAITLFNSDGMIDRTFGKNGYLTIDVGQIMHVDSPKELPGGFGLRVRNNGNYVTNLTFSPDGNPATVSTKREREPLPQ